MTGTSGDHVIMMKLLKLSQNIQSELKTLHNYIFSLKQVPQFLISNWRAVFNTPAWSYDTVRKECYLHQFAKEQPDLNYRKPEVRIEMLKMLKYWLEQGADGFRIDAINHAYEVEDLKDEIPKDPNGDLGDYNNYYHNHTMDLVRLFDFH